MLNNKASIRLNIKMNKIIFLFAIYEFMSEILEYILISIQNAKERWFEQRSNQM